MKEQPPLILPKDESTYLPSGTLRLFIDLRLDQTSRRVNGKKPNYS